MEITINTPALLFPAISLMLLAYTNRFLAVSQLVRRLHEEYNKKEKDNLLLHQIRSLRQRINIIKYTQALGVFSFLCCVITMYSIYIKRFEIAEFVFAISLLSLLVSLVLSLIEIFQSTKAIELQLSDMEDLEK